jgi:2,5-diamino-6-(ribosylamino)-4(3H)-pyrimidinone 5'-phosphate reductase
MQGGTPMRPYVICHMCTTIDGKILVDRWGSLPSGQSGGSLFEKTAASFGIHAWLVGTHTMKEFAAKSRPLKRARHSVPAGDYLGDPNARRFAIGSDSNGILRFSKNTVDGDHVVLLVTSRVSNDYLAHLRSVKVSYLICGRKHLNLTSALAKIRSRLGLRRLMLEGGGTFNGAMLRAGLIDEISQVMVPVVDGGRDVTSVFEIPGPGTRTAAAKLKVMRHRVLRGGIHWFRYRVETKAAARRT